jgi:hypothetical protein
LENDCPPQASSAAFNSQDIGTSRWQLRVEDYIGSSGAERTMMQHFKRFTA